LFFFSSRRRHTRLQGDWSSDVCSSDLEAVELDVRRGDLWRRPRKIVVGAAVDTVVSDVDRVEDEARSAPWTRARVGGVRQGRRRSEERRVGKEGGWGGGRGREKGSRVR